MNPTKRVEIITDLSEIRHMIKTLEERGITEYTLIKDVTGRGERGYRSGDQLTDVFNNGLLLIATQEEKLEIIVEVVNPVLKRYGGICLISDAYFLAH